MLIVYSVLLILSILITASSLFILSFGVNKGMFELTDDEIYIHPKQSSYCLIAASAALILGIVLFFISLSLLVG